MSDGYDGLKLCIDCGDAYTLGSRCTSCAQQHMIDNDDGPYGGGYSYDDEPCWCEGCGRILTCGETCTNTSCPDSPLLGTDWY